jgi:hypothetical protein
VREGHIEVVKALSRQDMLGCTVHVNKRFKDAEQQSSENEYVQLSQPSTTLWLLCHSDFVAMFSQMYALCMYVHVYNLLLFRRFNMKVLSPDPKAFRELMIVVTIGAMQQTATKV